MDRNKLVLILTSILTIAFFALTIYFRSGAFWFKKFVSSGDKKKQLRFLSKQPINTSTISW